MSDSAAKFDPARAGEYQEQSRIALAGYDACHELAAAILAAALGTGSRAQVLIVGAGGGAPEISNAHRLEPNWRFTAVDPSAAMLELTRQHLNQAGLDDCTELHLGLVEDLPEQSAFDAATLIGVLHHVPGDEAKVALLASIAKRLKPGAPLILAGNRLVYREHPLLLAAWGNRWRMTGATPAEVEVKLGKILQGADPPAAESTVFNLLADAGFERPLSFFSSLFWGAWIAYRAG
ncbi:class I SAM-dependent methyltransferase [Agaricicola taiwanensis]|uniref:class I SAM-dependent methyltransferase n=1 Tax=Agaricicola taiwanensis TaxID=591372 RepID=UPI001E31CB85|nr:class I SAM-dependent methyltransferase [Agaricicola taiwanensis]